MTIDAEPTQQDLAGTPQAATGIGSLSGTDLAAAANPADCREDACPSRASEIAVLGMGVMGRNLALNLAEHGFRVHVWNRNQDGVDNAIAEKVGVLRGTTQLAELVAALERPRKLILMITAGAPVDQTLELLYPLLEPGDVVVDGGNSWFEHSRQRESAARAAGLHFVGCGISGGESGARHGPSLMPGGSAQSYELLRPYLEAIAAKTESGPCVSHIGSDGAGHFVKMVHNGIEYADMQLIAESYDLLRKLGRMNASSIAAEVELWNTTLLESYLVELTAQVLRKKDGDGWLVDTILDEAAQKGTGRWTVQAAAELGVPIPAIAAAVDARALSSRRDTRRELAGVFDKHLGSAPPADFPSMLQSALLAGKILAYTQGFDLLREASQRYGWALRLDELARIWKGGCIIRARLLDHIMKAYQLRPELPMLPLDEELRSMLGDALPALRRIIALGIAEGIPLPAFSASLAYLDTLVARRLPQNLVQAQRDAFGAHTYRLEAEPDGPAQHASWLED